jgi:hypothetical protein
MIDLTDSQIGQLDGSNRPSTPRGLSSPASEKYVLRQANFHEKALFVKADVADPFMRERDSCVSFALCFHPL